MPPSSRLLPPAPAAEPAVATVRRLEREELPADTTALARWLIGKLVVRELAAGILQGRIVETEAYLPGDAAAHAFRGETPRNRSLFLDRGHAYVYIAYGTSFMLNVVGGSRGIGTGVLIRGLEPLTGIDLMRAHRGLVRDVDLTRGPGRLAAALCIDLRLNGADLCHPGPLRLGDDGWQGGEMGQNVIGRSVRIGITREAERPLRFYLCGNRFVSGPKWLNRQC